jgi:hypothetical protein
MAGMGYIPPIASGGIDPDFSLVENTAMNYYFDVNFPLSSWIIDTPLTEEVILNTG